MELPTRKQNRLSEYDYRTPAAYFITICTKERRCMLWDAVGATTGRQSDVKLSIYGQIVRDAITHIPKYYPAISVDHYVIMPNHVHLLLQIHTDADGRPMVAPTVSRVIQQLKGAVSKKSGFSIWQKGFHDHVIRNKEDYAMIWNYIDGNPSKWEEDRLFSDF